MGRKQQPRPEIYDTSGKKLSMGQFKAANERDLLVRAIPLSTLLANQILTRSQIDKFVVAGTLNKIEWGNKTYFDRNEVAECLRRASGGR